VGLSACIAEQQSVTIQNEQQLVQVGARIPAELAAEVARLADQGDRSISREIRRALQRHVGSAERRAPDSPAAEARAHTEQGES
jgi:Ribbon-helix-helix protein, copG family